MGLRPEYGKVVVMVVLLLPLAAWVWFAPRLHRPSTRVATWIFAGIVTWLAYKSPYRIILLLVAFGFLIASEWRLRRKRGSNSG